jgi:hypothetical protein
MHSKGKPAVNPNAPGGLERPSQDSFFEGRAFSLFRLAFQLLDGRPTALLARLTSTGRRSSTIAGKEHEKKPAALKGASPLEQSIWFA